MRISNDKIVSLPFKKNKNYLLMFCTVLKLIKFVFLYSFLNKLYHFLKEDFLVYFIKKIVLLYIFMIGYSRIELNFIIISLYNVWR